MKKALLRAMTDAELLKYRDRVKRRIEMNGEKGNYIAARNWTEEKVRVSLELLRRKAEKGVYSN